MRKAILFNDADEFSDFARVCGGSSPAPSRGGYALYWTRPRRGKGPALALMGWRMVQDAAEEWDGDPIETRRVEAEERDGDLVCKPESGGERFELEIVRRVPAETLLELVEPAPWKDEPAETGRVLFWLHDEALLPRLVADSLKLGNDRLQYARLSGADGRALLLRAESPPRYLVEWCREERPDSVDLFYSPAEDMHVEWGYSHPLEDLWKRSARPRGGSWEFFRPGRERHSVEPVRWSDIYDAAGFQLDFPVRDAWTQADPKGVRFALPLELRPRSRPADAELWLLREDERPRLERLLGVVDQEDLAGLLLSVQQDPEDGRKLYFVREKRERGQGRRHLDFGGEPFASYKGFHNLFLPVDRELQPQLRRDRYRSIFDLKQGELTVLAPVAGEDGTGAKGAARAWRFDERSFEPIEKLSDHVIDLSADRLETILERGVFDFGSYALSPARPDLLNKPDKPKPAKPAPKPGPRPDSADEEIAEAVEEVSLGKLQPPAIQAAFARTDMEKREAALERNLVKEGQSAEAWIDLAHAKSSLEKHGDAAICWHEALWHLERDTPEAAAARQALAASLDKWTASLKAASAERRKRKKDEGAPDAELPSEIEAGTAAAAREILRGEETPPGGIDAWLRSAAKTLRSAEGRLRAKERWLLWGEILCRNRDNREQARVREEIREGLARGGLALDEVPLFIRNRIFLDRELLEDAEDAEGDSAGEYRAALENLSVVENAVEGFPGEIVKKAGNAILGRAMARRLGETDRASVRLERALDGNEALAPGLRAWIDLYAAHAFELHSAARAGQFKARAEKAIDDLRAEEKKTLRDLEESLEGREKADNPAEFLSRENIHRFYPQTSGQGRQVDAMHKKLADAWESGDAERSALLVEEALNHVAAKLNAKKDKGGTLNFEPPKLVYLVVEVLDKLKWSGDGNRLAAAFEKFARGVGVDAWSQGFYGALLGVAVAQGLLRLRRERWAADHLNMGMKRLGEVKVALDFIDVASAMLNVVEGLPMADRARPLALAMEALGARVADDPKTWEGPWTAPFALKLMDQAVEAAVSKDKLALGYYKDYLQRDEMLVLERVLREDFCSA